MLNLVLGSFKQSVPQGSVGGPILFNFYCSTITSAIDEGCGIELGAFVDDHNLRKMFVPALPNSEKGGSTGHGNESGQNHGLDE